MAVNLGHEIEHTTDSNVQLQREYLQLKNMNNTNNIKSNQLKDAIEMMPNKISSDLTKEFERQKPILMPPIVFSNDIIIKY